MAAILLRLRTWWETADRTQKTVTLIGGGFLLVLLIGIFYFASRPKMEMAFGGLAAAEQGSVVEEIQKMGIPVEFDLSGSVLVPSSKVSEVKMRLATAGKLPSATHWGYGDLKDFGIMTTPRVEKERLKSVMEGELAKTIESFSSVSSARVHITLGEDSAFAAEKTPTTASVTIAEKPGGSISGEEAKAIASLVSNSVPGLSTKNLTVVDQNLKPIWLGSDETGANGLANEKIQAEVSESKRRERELQQKLDYFFGAGATAVTVDLKLDFNTETVNKREPIVGEAPVSQAKVTESMGGGSSPAPAGGPAGLSGNIGTPDASAPAQGGQDGSYTNKQEENQFAVGEANTQTQRAPGDVRSMAISVLVDTKKVPDPSQVESYVKSYLGPRAADTENFTATVTAVERNPALDAAAKTAAEAASGSNRMQQIFSLLPILALLIVAGVVVKSLAKAARSSNVLVAALPGGHVAPMALGPRPEPTAAPPLEGGTSVRKPPEYEFEEIQPRVNKPLEQIKRMASDRPEVVAMLIKSWLLEERR